MSDADKILGIVPKARYMYFTYMFLLISAAGNALFSLFSMIGLGFESGIYGCMVLGLLALVLTVVGMTSAKAESTPIEHAHFKYIALLFVGFFVLNIIFGGVYGISYMLGYLCTIALGAIQTILVFTGWMSLQGGRVITKDNLKEEIKLALAKR